MNGPKSNHAINSDARPRRTFATAQARRRQAPVIATLGLKLMDDIEIKKKLYAIKKRRASIYIAMVLLATIVLAADYLTLVPNYVTLFVFGGGILLLIPYMAFVSVSTCPKCNNNYFGGFPPRLDRSKCSYCGLELKEAIKPNHAN